jgi:VIT1/CCC1 family predicted Fe2+/Mn2+ transporter
VASFLSFASGAVLPLFPWFFISGTDAIVASIAIGVVAALALGGAIGAFTGRGVARTAFRQLVAAMVAAAITFGIGHLLGTQSG